MTEDHEIDPMVNFLEMTDLGQHRKDLLNAHSAVPSVLWTQLVIVRDPFGITETEVRQQHALLI